jgi:putative hemolysin
MVPVLGGLGLLGSAVIALPLGMLVTMDVVGHVYGQVDVRVYNSWGGVLLVTKRKRLGKIAYRYPGAERSQ